MKNNIFHSARLKLTAWYLLIIMVISILFSLIIYNGINNELMRMEQIQQMRRHHIEELFRDFPHPDLPRDDSNEIKDARQRLILTLALINVSILCISGLAGYFLAGLTLRPIKRMIEGQNRFIADASHELRTPLTALRSEIEVNLRDKDLALPDAKKLLQSNLEETVHLQLLSDNLIKLTGSSQIDSLSLSSLQLSSVVDEAIKKVTPLAKQKKITIHNKTPKVTIEGDRQSLMELFVILLDNAVKYSPEQKVVTITAIKLKDTVRIEIIDEGIGIDKKDLPHIFDRFYRVDTSRSKPQAGGYGLGLSIAKNIVESHSGMIKVESKVNHGTTFIVELPL